MSALLTPDRCGGHDACMPAQNPVASRLSRDVIVDAYLRLVEAEDNDSVSLRRLGSELGVDPTAVYRHFRDKDDILTAAADRLLAEVTDGLELSGGWRDHFAAGDFRCLISDRA